MIKLEICTESIASILAAVEGGASRIELCSNLSQGGTTPPYSLIEEALKIASIEIFILIRPRSGDYLYTNEEFDLMKADIVKCGKMGCDGVVFGILTAEGKIDKSRNIELIEIARKYKMQITFHRAIDRTQNIFDSLKDIISLGYDRVLTSGGEKNVMAGKETIKQMIKEADNRITILPGVVE